MRLTVATFPPAERRPELAGRARRGANRLRCWAASILTQVLGLLVLLALAQLGAALLSSSGEPPLVVTVLGFLPLLLLWRRLAARLRPLHEAAAHWERGEWSWRTGLQGEDELGQLGSTLDRMAAQLGATVQELEAALARANELARLAEEREARLRAFAQAEKLRALGQMAGGVAHDLNQSLALLAGYGDLARRAAEQDPADLLTLRETLPILVRAAIDGGEIVKRLLVFGRGPIEGEAQWLELSGLLREVAQLTAPRWRDAAQQEGRPISLHVESRGDTTIRGWPAGLREAFTNLVFNAVDALPGGGRIRLAARRDGDRVEVEIADSGIGIPTELQHRVFDPFFTTKGERGTGLGLAQVARIVQEHGGTVELRSAPGEGTVIRLTFPAHQGLAGVEATPVPGEATGGPLRILAVDDEPALGRMIGLMLGQHGHHVATALSAEEAIDRLTREPFDVVISDIGMGEGMNGWDLARLVRQRWPRLRFILATGWGAQIDPEQARGEGVAGVVAKPYRLADLERFLRAEAPDAPPATADVG